MSKSRSRFAVVVVGRSGGILFFLLFASRKITDWVGRFFAVVFDMGFVLCSSFCVSNRTDVLIERLVIVV